MSAGGGGAGGSGGYGNRYGANYMQPGYGFGSGSGGGMFNGGQPGMMYPMGGSGGYGGSGVGGVAPMAADGMPTFMGSGNYGAGIAGGANGGNDLASGYAPYGRDMYGRRNEDYAGGMSPWNNGMSTVRGNSVRFNAIPNMPGATPRPTYNGLQSDGTPGIGTLAWRQQNQNDLAKYFMENGTVPSTSAMANMVAGGYRPPGWTADSASPLWANKVTPMQLPDTTGMTEAQRRSAIMDYFSKLVPNYGK